MKNVKSWSCKLSQNGIGLIEVIIASALVLIVALGVGSYIQHLSKAGRILGD
jgi:Tfp pilus assembly protein PilV